MRILRAQTFALFALLALLAACSGTTSSAIAPSAAERQPGEALVGKSFGTSNGMNMGFREFDEVAARRGAMAKNLTEEQRKDIVDGLIDEKLLYLKAVEHGVDLDPKIQRMVVNTFLKDHVYKKVRETSPTQDELMGYFEAHKEDFVVPEKRQVKRILIKPRDGEDETTVAARAQQVRSALSGDGLADWNGLAAKHSGGPYKDRGGDLGYVGNTERPGVDPAVITKAFEQSGVGVTDVFETKEGLNILYVTAVRPRVDRTFSQIKGAVARKAKGERYKAAFENYVTELRSGAKQDINWDAVNDHAVRGSRRLKPPKPVRREAPVAPSLSAKPEAPRSHSDRK
jgi:hypothetical protein